MEQLEPIELDLISRLECFDVVLQDYATRCADCLPMTDRGPPISAPFGRGHERLTPAHLDQGARWLDPHNGATVLVTDFSWWVCSSIGHGESLLFPQEHIPDDIGLLQNLEVWISYPQRVTEYLLVVLAEEGRRRSVPLSLAA
jgi:hypothetical protein